MGTGTISHELGHGIGLLDLYDRNEANGDSKGIGWWGLMGTGGWNIQTSPAHMSAWSKDRLGWLTVTVVDQFGTPVSLSSVQQSGSVVRIDDPDPSSDEYFLLANRQRVGSDEHLRQPGLLIWHIDPEQIVRGIVNDDENHKGVDLEEADGRDDLDHSRNRGDRGDPFPGSTGKTSFTRQSYPSSHSYVGGSSCTVGVRSIRLAGSVAYFDVNASERIRMLGDANGDLQVDSSDVNETNWYALGYRGGTIQLDEADVDRDGDVDIRDAFLIHSHYAGYSVPVSGIGSLEVVECDPLASHIAAVEASSEIGVESVAVKGAVKRGGSR